MAWRAHPPGVRPLGRGLGRVAHGEPLERVEGHDRLGEGDAFSVGLGVGGHRTPRPDALAVYERTGKGASAGPASAVTVRSALVRTGQGSTATGA